jgi:hypothetical protein
MEHRDAAVVAADEQLADVEPPKVVDMDYAAVNLDARHFRIDDPEERNDRMSTELGQFAVALMTPPWKEPSYLFGKCLLFAYECILMKPIPKVLVRLIIIAHLLHRIEGVIRPDKRNELDRVAGDAKILYG